MKFKVQWTEILGCNVYMKGSSEDLTNDDDDESKWGLEISFELN